MNRMALVYLLLASTSSFAADGSCVARGRAAGDRACVNYDNTDETICLASDGYASCVWQPSIVRGTGPIRVECLKDFPPTKVYYANEIFYTGETGALTAMGFGPNRQDDGFAKLEGNCVVRPKREL